MFSCSCLITEFSLKIDNLKIFSLKHEKDKDPQVTYVAWLCLKTLSSNITNYILRIHVLLFAFKTSPLCLCSVFTSLQSLFLPFDKTLSTKFSQIFNKWTKAITVKTWAAASAFSSFILCTSYQPYNFLSFRVSDRFSSLWSQRCCPACWSIHPLNAAFTLPRCSTASESADVHHHQLF